MKHTSTLLRRRGAPKLELSKRRALHTERVYDSLEGIEVWTFHCPRDLKLQFKIAAIDKGTTMRSLIVKALKFYAARKLQIQDLANGDLPEGS